MDLCSHSCAILCQVYVCCWRKKTLRSSQDSNLGPLNPGQMLLPTEPLDLNVFESWLDLNVFKSWLDLNVFFRQHSTLQIKKHLSCMLFPDPYFGVLLHSTVTVNEARRILSKINKPSLLEWSLGYDNQMAAMIQLQAKATYCRPENCHVHTLYFLCFCLIVLQHRHIHISIFTVGHSAENILIANFLIYL